MTDLIFFGGQSNMQGQTESLLKKAPVKNALEYRLLTDELIPLQNPVGEDIDELLLSSAYGHGSLIPDFTEAYIKKSERSVVCAHVAKGATILADWQKNGESGKARYQKLVEKCKGAKNKVKDAGKTLFIWLQGESDALAHTSKNDYEKMLKTFKNDLQNDLNIDAFMIIEVGYFASNFGGREYDEQIMAAQEELCLDGANDGFYMLTDITKKLSLDQKYINPIAVGHFNNEAMQIIGSTAGEKAAEIALNLK